MVLAVMVLAVVVLEKEDEKTALEIYKDLLTATYGDEVVVPVGTTAANLRTAINLGVNTVDNSLNHIDTSKVASMNALFKNETLFNTDISKWYTGEVKNMAEMFFGANKFNADIGKWKTGKVTTMKSMFSGAAGFKQDIRRLGY